MLAVNEYALIDPLPADSGCSVFPSTTVAAEYLIVPQLTAGNPGDQAGFRLFGDTILPVFSAAAPAAPASQALAEPSSAERFHTFLRLGDERRSWGFAPRTDTPPAGGASPRLSATAGPPAFNELRTFQVCAKLDCTRFDSVGARVKALRTKVAIYVDTLAPPGGLDSTALDALAAVFDQRLYSIATAAFGVESDIDANTVVMVLMTNTVNKLVPASQCQDGFVAGFFFGVDLDPRFSNDSRSNKGEVFYTIVADPAGTLSCPHSGAVVQAIVPVTLIHEFQHMISFNQHVLEGGAANGEVLWLNEGFSHYAEELAGRSYELNPEARLENCTIGTTPCRFYSGNFLNAYDYLDTTSKHFLLPTEGIGTLTERGAAWLFVRYLVDQYAAGTDTASWNARTRSLVQTSRSGAANIEFVTEATFDSVVSRWALANWVTDVGGVPPELTYKSWNMHSVFSSLRAQQPSLFPKFYPLEPTVSAGRAVNLSGTLRSGSPIYHRATQPPGDPGFTLSFTAPSGGLINSAFKPRLNVIRLQ